MGATLALVFGLMAAACYPPVGVGDPYVAIVHGVDEITPSMGVVYSSVEDDTGTMVDLALDVFQPPTDGRPRPTIVLFHGGSFQFGSRGDLHYTATLWVQRGYVAVTPSYRLSSASAVDLTDSATSLDAVADGQTVIKWLRANADTYGIDVNRIAVFGSSAGGVISTMTATSRDFTGTRHSGPESHVANAAFATGAPVFPLVEDGYLVADEVAAPLLFEHNEVDLATSYTGDDARVTCLLWLVAETACELVITPGPGHTVSLDPFGPISASVVMPFLDVELNLADAPVPGPPTSIPGR